VSFRVEQDDDGVVIEVEGGAPHGFGHGGSRPGQGGKVQAFTTALEGHGPSQTPERA
jgi:hypothetical protein